MFLRAPLRASCQSGQRLFEVSHVVDMSGVGLAGPTVPHSHAISAHKSLVKCVIPGLLSPLIVLASCRGMAIILIIKDL